MNEVMLVMPPLYVDRALEIPRGTVLMTDLVFVSGDHDGVSGEGTLEILDTQPHRQAQPLIQHDTLGVV